jgi:hypothetical protein
MRQELHRLEVSEFLQAWTARDRSVLDRLTPIVYDELHRHARRYMKGERPGHSVCHAGRRRQSKNRPSGLPHPVERRRPRHPLKQAKAEYAKLQ